jgi:sRNA-binding regulator protein Hfq
MDEKLVKTFLKKHVKVIKADGFNLDGIVTKVSKDSLLLERDGNSRLIAFFQILELREISKHE